MHIEHKSIEFELKAFDEEQGIFEGYAAVFNNVDNGNDRILPGAFQKSIKEWGPKGKNRIKVLALHKNQWLPIGLPIEMSEDANGLLVKAKISDTTMGKDVKTLIKDGVFTELSIGYNATDYFYDAQKVRNIKEANLFEFSPVIWAMNAEAGINSYKSAEKGGENLEDHMIGLKSFSFNQALSMEQLRRMKWQIGDALDTSMHSIMNDENMNIQQKIAALDETLTQYHQTALEVYSKLLGLIEAEKAQRQQLQNVNAAIESMKSSIDSMEVKAGAKISKANMEKIKAAMTSLKEIMEATSVVEDEVDEETKTMIQNQMLELKSITQGGKQ